MTEHYPSPSKCDNLKRLPVHTDSVPGGHPSVTQAHRNWVQDPLGVEGKSWRLEDKEDRSWDQEELLCKPMAYVKQAY